MGKLHAITIRIVRVIDIKIGSDYFATGLGKNHMIILWNTTHDGVSAVLMHITNMYSV